MPRKKKIKNDTSEPKVSGPKPKIVFSDQTLRTIQMLAERFVPEKEIAAVFDCTYATFWTFKKKYPVVQDIIDIGRGRVAASIREQQLKKAMSGNVAMLIWLGKNYLGQTDHRQLTGPGGGAVRQVNIDAKVLSDMSDEELAALESALGKLGPSGNTDPAGDGKG